MPAPAQSTAAINDAMQDMVAQTQALSRALAELTKTTAPLARAGKDEAEQKQQSVSAMAGVQAAMGGMVAGAQMAVGAFQQAAGAMRPFVEAFSPSAILMFDAAMRDLSAVIGSAVLPFFNLLTGALRSFASILLPAVQEMAPVIDQIAGVFGELLAGAMDQIEMLMEPVKAIVELFAVLLDVLKPVMKLFQAINQVLFAYVGLLVNNAAVILGLLLQALKPILDIMGAMAPIWKALSVIIAGITNAIKVWAQSLSLAWGGDFVETFTDAMQQLAKAAILAAAALAKMLGLEGFVEGMKRALGGERRGAAGFAAPQDARVQTDIQAFARQMAEAAAVATTPGADTKSEEQKWRESTLEALKTLKTPEEFWKAAEEPLTRILLAVQKAAGEKVYEAAKPAVTEATSIAADVAVSGIPGGIARSVARRVGW
jgi:hypothetical protein